MCTYLEAYSPKCLPRPSEKPWKHSWRGPIDYREGSFGPLFGLLITSESAFEASLGPPFGQAQKVNSANLLVTEVSEVGSKYGGALASWWCSYSGHARRCCFAAGSWHHVRTEAWKDLWRHSGLLDTEGLLDRQPSHHCPQGQPNILLLPGGSEGPGCCEALPGRAKDSHCAGQEGRMEVPERHVVADTTDAVRQRHVGGSHLLPRLPGCRLDRAAGDRHRPQRPQRHPPPLAHGRCSHAEHRRVCEVPEHPPIPCTAAPNELPVPHPNYKGQADAFFGWAA